VTMFFFIFFNNLFGLLPGVGEAITYNGEPLFRAFTADLNGTLAIAVVSIILVEFFAIRETGPLKHLKHFFNGSFKNPITYLLGIFEMFSELTRVLSLALRLFLNIAIGEIIIGVFAYLGHAIAPLTSLPFVILELFVCVLQAYIFVMLSIMYLSVAIHHEDSVGGIEHPESVEPRSKSHLKTVDSNVK
jgi:F-type H+-transporting ATPase subunit a